MVKESAFGTSRTILMSLDCLVLLLAHQALHLQLLCLPSGCRSWKHRATKSIFRCLEDHSEFTFSDCKLAKLILVMGP